MPKPDYYKILGVPRTATEAEIKKAYRKLARIHHPDLNKGDKSSELKFQEINEANEVLSNKENRAKYDQYGSDWAQAEAFEKAQASAQSNRRSGFRENFQTEDYSDIFDSFFGRTNSGSRSQNTPIKGRDFNAELKLDLTDVYITHKRTLTIGGNSIRITIPAGVTNGQIIKIKGQGGKSPNNGPSGDLFITFIINNNTKYNLEGNNLSLEVDIGLYTALLGGDIFLETLAGKVKMKVLPETQNKTKVKLSGKGFPKYKKEGQFGDLYITYNVILPTKLTNKEKELFIELQNIRKLKPKT